MDQNTQTPVKLVAMLWRQPDMTFDQFVDHWLNHHGTSSDTNNTFDTTRGLAQVCADVMV